MQSIPIKKSYDKKQRGVRHQEMRLLGIATDDSVRIYQRVKSGLPFSCLVHFQKVTELPWEVISPFIGISQRTITRRKSQRKLHPNESDRLWRAAVIFDLLMDFFEGDKVMAGMWLQKPQLGLGGEIPLNYASTSLGAREIENLICKLDHGVFT